MSLPPASGRVLRSGGLGRRRCAMTPSVGPAVLDGWMQPFRCHFTAAVGRHVLVLVCGALLAPGRRTVAAALRVMGLGEVAVSRRTPQCQQARVPRARCDRAADDDMPGNSGSMPSQLACILLTCT